MMRPYKDFSAAVLAGGRSSRFGSDKAAYYYKGQTLLEHVLASFATANERFIIAGHDYGLKLTYYPDIITGGGALSGLHAALSHSSNDWLALAACDMPNLSPDYWQFLLARRKKGSHVVIVQHEEGWLEPLAALYHRDLLLGINKALAAKDYRLQNLIKQSPCVFIPIQALGSLALDKDVFFNANYVKELEP